MIYPKKKSKVRSFSIGGAMGSLFDNPGTYLGIQYMPKAVETPDLEGLQYILQQNEAERILKAEKAKASRPNMGELKVDGLTGESMDFLSTVEQSMNDWASKYDTPEKMISPEALAESARINRRIMEGTIMLKNNKDLFGKQYDENKDLMSDTYFNNGHVVLRNSRNPSERKDVSVDDYFANKDGEYAEFSPMTVGELFDWKMNYSPMGAKDNFNINQYSNEKVDAYFDTQMKNIASDITSVSGGEQLAGELAKIGLDYRNLDIGKFKLKIKSGEINARTVFNTMIDQMDAKARNFIMSKMATEGQNPYEKVTVEVGPEGNKEQIETTRFALWLEERFTGQKAKYVNSETELEIESKEEQSKKASGEGGSGKLNLLSLVINRQTALKDFADTWDISSQTQTGTVFNPYKAENEIVPVMSLPNFSTEDAEAILGHKIGFNEILDNVTMFAGGHMVSLSNEDFEGGNTTGAKFYEYPYKGSLKIYDVTDNEGKVNPMAAHDKYILVNEAGISKFRTPEGEPVSKKNYKDAKYMKKVFASDIEAVANSQNANPGSVKLESNWFTDLAPGEDQYLYLVRVEQPLNALSGMGTLSPSAPTQAHLEGRQNLENRKVEENKKIMGELDPEKVRNITDYMRINGR